MQNKLDTHDFPRREGYVDFYHPFGNNRHQFLFPARTADPFLLENADIFPVGIPVCT